MKFFKSIPLYLLMFHVFKAFILTYKNIPDLYKGRYNQIPRHGSIINIDERTDRQYLFLLYMLSRKLNQKRIGLRTYRVLRICLKMYVHVSKFDSREDRLEEYHYMLKLTKLW